jgi:hypothetical protein
MLGTQLLARLLPLLSITAAATALAVAAPSSAAAAPNRTEAAASQIRGAAPVPAYIFGKAVTIDGQTEVHVAWRADSEHPCHAPVAWQGPRYNPCGIPFDTPDAQQLHFEGCGRHIWLMQGGATLRDCVAEYRTWDCLGQGRKPLEFMSVSSFARC